MKPVEVSVERAGAPVASLIAELEAGHDVIITRDGRPIAKMVPVSSGTSRALLGSGKGTVLYMSDDFDAPLDEFKDYM